MKKIYIKISSTNIGTKIFRSDIFYNKENKGMQFPDKRLIAVLLLLIVTFFVERLNAQHITSFSPESGNIGTTITLSGNGFNTTPSNNVVFFGAVRGPVTGATANSLTVTVPVGATYQNISNTNLANNLTAYSSKPFNVLFSARVTPDFAAKIDYGTGTSPFSVCIGDLNGDGKSDMAVANISSNSVSVYRNISIEGTVNFATKVDYPTGSSSYCVAFGDLNGDGKPDMVVVNWDNSTVSVFLNTSINGGNISFVQRVDFQTGLNPHSVAIGDIDGDGKPDLATANWNGSSITVLRNTSAGGIISFAGKVDFTEGAGITPISVNIGDLNGDGKPDVVTSNWYSNTISIFQNSSSPGTISFTSFLDYETFDLPDYVGIGDLDGDGKNEMTVSCRGTNNVSIFRNTSSAGILSFAPRVDFPTGPHPFFVSISDLNGDSKPDLAVPCVGYSSFDNISSPFPIDISGLSNPSINGDLVSILTNESTPGNINFDTTLSFITAVGPFSSSIGDIDGDGLPDLAITNAFSNSVSVLRNVSASILNIKVIPQGLYNATTHRLNLRDTVRAYLHSNISPFNVVDSAVALIDSVTFTGKFYFPNAPTGNYYIKIKHRNSIETWSRTGGEAFTSGSSMSYDFTSAAPQAYGNNQIQVDNAPVRFGIYSGDVTQDGIIDLTDIVQINNAASMFETGYKVTDLNGNNITDVADILIAYNNSGGFVTAIEP